MAAAVGKGGIKGGPVLSTAEKAELKRFAELKRYPSEQKLSAGSWNQQVVGWEKQGEAAANADINRAVAKFRAAGNAKGLVRYLQDAAARARNEANVLEGQLEMMKWHLVVDVLSIVDPSPASDGVSIWMDMQEAGN